MELIIIQGIRCSLNHSEPRLAGSVGLRCCLKTPRLAAWENWRFHGHGMPWENARFVDDLWPLSMAHMAMDSMAMLVHSWITRG